MGIYSCKTGCMKMYVYDETTGKKGSNERVSFLKHYIDNCLSEEVKIMYFSVPAVQAKKKAF